MVTPELEPRIWALSTNLQTKIILTKREKPTVSQQLIRQIW